MSKKCYCVVFRLNGESGVWVFPNMGDAKEHAKELLDDNYGDDSFDNIGDVARNYAGESLEIVMGESWMQ